MGAFWKEIRDGLHKLRFRASPWNRFRWRRKSADQISSINWGTFRDPNRVKYGSCFASLIARLEFKYLPHGYCKNGAKFVQQSFSWTWQKAIGKMRKLSINLIMDSEIYLQEKPSDGISRIKFAQKSDSLLVTSWDSNAYYYDGVTFKLK